MSQLLYTENHALYYLAAKVVLQLLISGTNCYDINMYEFCTTN